MSEECGQLRLYDQMVKSRSRKPDQHELLSVTDVRAAFQSFAAADNLRLEKAGRYLGWKCRTDGDELLGEAVMRALNGDRRCPRHLPAVQFLIGVMKSLASEIIEKRNSDPLAYPTNQNSLSPSGLLACFATELPGPEELLLAKEEEEYMKAVVADIEALFANDEQAQ